MATVLHLINPKSVRNYEELVVGAKNFALLNGVCMRPLETPYSSDSITPAPMTLFPSVVPRRSLDEVKSLQTKFNQLMHNVAHDHKFLENCLQRVIKVDEFTRKLWEIYCDAKDLRNKPQICLGLFRNDFMMDVGENQLEEIPHDLAKSVKMKQVEFNTIAASLGGLVTQLTDVHRYNVSRIGYNDKEKLLEHLPKNSPSTALAKGLIKAWDVYRKENKPSRIPAILFIVGKPEKNALDQLWIENQIFKQNTRAPVIYRTLSEIKVTEKPDSVDFPLVVDGIEVAVVYYRDGYAPNHYRNEEDEDESKVISMALQNPGAYVLKPQREGGGNNLYDEELKKILLKIKDTEERKGTEDPIMNEECGHLMRTKALGINEGSVTSGFSTLDTPFLIDTL